MMRLTELFAWLSPSAAGRLIVTGSHVIGRRHFTDGSDRNVSLDAEGQYVLDEGVKMRGVWIAEDEAAMPLVVQFRINWRTAKQRTNP